MPRPQRGRDVAGKELGVLGKLSRSYSWARGSFLTGAPSQVSQKETSD